MESSIIEKAREFMESSRKRKKKKKEKKRAKNERAREIRRKEGSGIKWNVKEKKRNDGILWVYVCGGQNAREKKKKKRKRKGKCMDERKAKNQKSQFKLLPQYFHNKF